MDPINSETVFLDSHHIQKVDLMLFAPMNEMVVEYSCFLDVWDWSASYRCKAWRNGADGDGNGLSCSGSNLIHTVFKCTKGSHHLLDMCGDT